MNISTLEYYSLYLTEDLTRLAIEKGCPVAFSMFTSTWEKQRKPRKYLTIKESYVEDGISGTLAYYYALPTIEQVLEWLRKEKSCDIIIETNNMTNKYILSWVIHDTFSYKQDNKVYPTYYEAALEGIKIILQKL